MRYLRLVAVFCILLQLSRADPSGINKDEDIQQQNEGPDEVVEATDAPYERKLSPRERQAIEEEERWQRDMEEWERREREAVLNDPGPVEDTPQEMEADESGQQDSFDQEEFERYMQERLAEDAAYNAQLEQQRRLEEENTQPVEVEDDEEEVEILPTIPGLTDVELIAFNPEYANAEVLEKIIDWSYDQVAMMSLYRDNYIHVEDLYLFLLKTLNPLDEEIDAEDEEILTNAVAELRKQQGLVDKEQVLYRGFIARGMPLRFLQSLAHEMHQTVQTRRLQASVGRDEL